MTVGVVCHRLLPEDLAALRSMGVRHVRLSLYPDSDGGEWVQAAVDAGLVPLVVSYRDRLHWDADAAVWPMAEWQYGNEPEDLDTIPPTPGDASPGIRNDTPAGQIRRYAARMPHGQRLALHVYGQPLRLAAERRLEAADGTGRRLWVTEIGQVGGTGADLLAALETLEAAVVERAYVYALWSPEDGYSMTPEQRAVVRDWNRAVSSGRP